MKIHPESGNCSEMAAKVGRAASCRERRRGEGSYRSDLKLFRTGNTPASGSRVVRF